MINFWGIPKLHSIMAASFYININNVWKCQSFPFLSEFLSILTATLTATTGLCWLLMLSNSSCAYLLLHISEKMSDLLLISHLSYVFVLLSCKSAGNRLQISLLIYHLFSCSRLTFLMVSFKYQHFQFWLGPIWIVFSLFWASDNVHNEVFPNLRSASILVFSSRGSMILVTLGLILHMEGKFITLYLTK